MSPSPRVSVCRSRRQHGGPGSSQPLGRKNFWSQVGGKADKVLRPAADVKGDQYGAALWCVKLGCLGSGLESACYALKKVYSTPLGLFDKCLGTPDGKCGISPGAYLWVVPFCRRGSSNHMCRYLGCVFLPDMSSMT